MKDNGEKKPLTDNSEKKPLDKKRIILIVLCAVLALVLVVLIFVTAYMEGMLGLINKKDPAQDGTISSSELEEFLKATEEVDPDFTGPTMNAEDVIWGNLENIEPLEGVINILLIGQDRRPGETRARSDAMILCTINPEKKTLSMTSFLRDMYVQIPGYMDNRINASYAFGGMTLLDATLEKNFGIVVDGNVEVDFSGFMDIIELLGGVEIELTEAEASYLNRRGNWGVDTSVQWNLQAGKQLLNGSQALAYSRIRAIGGDGDFGRTNRQRTVLNALMQKAKTMSILELNNLLTQILPLLTTDLSNAEILNYAAQILPMLNNLELNTLRIPADGTYQMTMINGMSVLLPNLEKNRDLLEEAMVG